nr:oligosaccharide flippase family protein [uncultured Flavobacterium sp.]
MIANKYIHLLQTQKAKNFIIYGFGQAINLISPLLVIPYLISRCGEEGLGKVGVGYSFALIAIVIVDYGSYINGTKEISIHNNQKALLEEKFTTIYISKLILLIGVLLFSLLLLYTVPFFSRDFEQLLFSLLIVVGQFINPTWFFQGIQNFKWISIINVLSKVIYLALVFLCIKSTEDYIWANAFFGIGLILASSIGFIWICKKYAISFQEASFSKGIALIKTEFSLTVSQLFFSLYQYAPIMMISFIGGDFMAGQYRVIDQIIMIFRTYFQMFFNFIYAEVCLKIYENSTKGIKSWIKSNGLNYLLVIFILVLFYIFAHEILAFFKVDMTTETNLIGLFRVGLIIPVFMGISFALKQLMFSFNENKAYINITILSTIISLAVMYFNIITLGLIGSFLTIIIIEFLIIITYLIILKPNIFVKNN